MQAKSLDSHPERSGLIAFSVVLMGVIEHTRHIDLLSPSQTRAVQPKLTQSAASPGTGQRKVNWCWGSPFSYPRSQERNSEAGCGASVAVFSPIHCVCSSHSSAGLSSLWELPMAHTDILPFVLAGQTKLKGKGSAKRHCRKAQSAGFVI